MIGEKLSTWQEWEEQLGLTEEANIWYANTPHGRREVKITTVNFSTAIVYQFAGIHYATQLPQREELNVPCSMRICKLPKHKVCNECVTENNNIELIPIYP
jgi:hypothetical protein